MIVTTIEKSQEVLDKYNSLFEEAGNLIGETIMTLRDYYNFLPEIIRAAKSEGNWQHFTMLPLDEDLFIINANTRKITVPNSFKTIGLEGEAYAETVYFKINRYFDVIDFNSANCVIEWKINDIEGAS